MLTKEYILSKIKTKKHELTLLGVRAIGVFGSLVRNEQSQNSDIDILIDFEEEKETFDNYMAVYDIIERLFSNHKIDVVTKNGLSPYIGPTILNEVKYA